MRKCLMMLMIVMQAACSNTKMSKQTTATTVFVLSEQSLAANRSKVANKEAEMLSAYEQLIKEADNALKEGPFSVMEKKQVPPSGDMHDYMSLAPYHWPDSSKPNGLPYIRKDGQTNPEVRDYTDKQYQPKMIGLVQSLALAYYFSGQEKYAEHASLLLRTWFLDTATRMNPNMNFAQAIKGVTEGRGAGLIDARHYIKLVDAIGLIKQSKHWKVEDQAGMQQWFGAFLNWMQTSKNGIQEGKAANNHGTWYDALRLSLALFTRNTNAANDIIVTARERLDKQMDERGYFPKEMERTMSLHYSAFNLEAFFLIAEMAEHVGIDLWNYESPKGNSLRKAFNVLKPYLANEKQWEGRQIKDLDYEEDAYPLLIMAAANLHCTDCREAIRRLPGKKAAQVRITLLY